jgi:hypothetical protein
MKFLMNYQVNLINYLSWNIANMNFGNCETTTEQNIIVLKENRSRLLIKNSRNEKIRRIVVDGCAITEGQRCDFLIIDANSGEYFVELKGCDVEHAIKQLEATIKQLGAKVKTVKRHSIIISSRCPLLTTKIQKFKLYFRKNLMSNLIIKNHLCEITI